VVVVEGRGLFGKKKVYDAITDNRHYDLSINDKYNFTWRKITASVRIAVVVRRDHRNI